MMGNILYGKLSDCQNCSKICSFRCCDQSFLPNEKVSLENSILLYPGEFEAIPSNLFKEHIEIRKKYCGGYLAYCNPQKIRQDLCGAINNFKPLDCFSYPFFPTIVNNDVRLLVDDTRCPLDFNCLKEHYKITLKTWQDLSSKNEEIFYWIQQIKLRGYSLVSDEENFIR